MPRRVKDLPVTADIPALDDYEDLDGATNGSRKLPASWRMGVYASRQPLLGLSYSDGVTTGGRRIQWMLGAAGNVAGSPLSEAEHLIRVPGSNPSISAIIWSYSANSTLVETSNALLMRINSAGALDVVMYGATTADFRLARLTGFRAAYAGQWVRLDVVIDPATGPTVYINGVDSTSAFTSSTGGTPPDWMSAAMSTNYRVCGAYWPAGEFRPGVPINRALSASEIAQMVQTGAILPNDRLGGSVDAVASWDGTTVSGLSVSGTGATIDASTTPGVITWATGSGNNYIQTGAILTYGRRYRVRLGIRLVSGTASSIQVGSGGSGGAVAMTVTPTSSVQTYAAEWVAAGGVNANRLVLNILSANGSVYEISDIALTPVGALIQPEITRTAQVLDNGPNRIHGIMTAGIRPLCDRAPVPIRGTQAATGYLLGLGASDPLFFEPALIKAIRVKPTATAATTITLRHNTSGGTTIGTVTTSTLGQWVSLPFTAGVAYEVAAGDRLHLTIDAAVEIEIDHAPL